MIALYLTSLGFGSVLVGVSLLFSGDADSSLDHETDLDFDHDVQIALDHDLEVDADVDINVDADLEVDADVDAHLHAGDSPLTLHREQTQRRRVFRLLPLSSIRFWSFGSLVFGLTGTALHLALGDPLLTPFVATAFGYGSGVGMAGFFQLLKTSEVSGEISLDRFVGEEARVLITVRPDSLGKVVIQGLSGRVELAATTGDDSPLEVGQTVLIVHIDGGRAQVTRLKTLPGKSSTDLTPY